MNAQTEFAPATRLSLSLRDYLRRAAAMAVFISIFVLAAGRWDWLAGWIYTAVFLCCQSALLFILAKKNPHLFRRRIKPQTGTKRWDFVVLGVYQTFLLAMLVVAGLDSGRYGWSTVPLWVSLGAYALYVPLIGLAAWSMTTNQHFEATVRIQTDLDHRVVSNGPYRYLRHPGYATGIVGIALIPLMLQSYWALLPGAAAIGALVVRTALEDKTLQNELEGYRDYAHKVRYRLLWGIW